MLHLASDKFAFAVPVAVGIKWTKGGEYQNADETAPSVIDSATQYFERKYGKNGPPGPEALYPPPVRPPETVSVMGVHTVEGPSIKYEDWLSNIAKKWYGDMLLWPVLFDFNRGPDFSNPNKMYVGQRVKIPFINDKSQDEIKAYRKEGMTGVNKRHFLRRSRGVKDMKRNYEIATDLLSSALKLTY